METSTPTTNEAAPITPNPLEPKDISALRFIYANIAAAQKVTGAFTMADCRELLKSFRSLAEFFVEVNNNIDETPKKLAGEEVISAFNVLIKAAEVQQAKGVFSIEGSVELLDNIEFIEQALNKLKDPNLKLKEIKDKSKIGKKIKKKNK